MKSIKALFSSHIGMMLICCAAMVGAYFLFAESAAQGSTLAALAPLIACLGMHFFMMKVMGKNCHADQKNEEKLETPAPKLLTDTASKINS
jgi:hypothetical protein